MKKFPRLFSQSPYPLSLDLDLCWYVSPFLSIFSLFSLYVCLSPLLPVWSLPFLSLSVFPIAPSLYFLYLYFCLCISLSLYISHYLCFFLYLHLSSLSTLCLGRCICFSLFVCFSPTQTLATTKEIADCLLTTILYYHHIGWHPFEFHGASPWN